MVADVDGGCLMSWDGMNRWKSWFVSPGLLMGSDLISTGLNGLELHTCWPRVVAYHLLDLAFGET